MEEFPPPIYHHSAFCSVSQMSPQWQKLATESLIEASEPPVAFPTPKPLPFTASTFQRVTLELKKVQKERDDLQQKCERLQNQNDQLVLESHKKQHSQKRENEKMHQHLTGAVRRIQWLLQERQKVITCLDTFEAPSQLHQILASDNGICGQYQLMSKTLNSERYTARLEKKLLRQHASLQAKQGKGYGKREDTSKPFDDDDEDDGDGDEDGSSDDGDGGDWPRGDGDGDSNGDGSDDGSSNHSSPTRQLQKLSILVENLMMEDSGKIDRRSGISA